VANVLVIGDSRGIVDVLRSSLQADGHEVTSTADVIKGERLALAHDVTLVVLGRTVSARDGLDVVTDVRRGRPGVRIIVLSDYAEVGDRIAAFDAGATDFLASPFSPEELVAHVRAQLRRAAWT
jgi:DNA-binding response OmpR family regulator